MVCGDDVNIGKPFGTAPGTSIGGSLGIFAWAYVPSRTTVIKEIHVALQFSTFDPLSYYDAFVVPDVSGEPGWPPLDMLHWTSGIAYSLNPVQVDAGKQYWIGMEGSKPASLPSVQGDLVTMHEYISQWGPPTQRLPIAFSVVGDCP